MKIEKNSRMDEAIQNGDTGAMADLLRGKSPREIDRGLKYIAHKVGKVYADGVKVELDHKGKFSRFLNK